MEEYKDEFQKTFVYVSSRKSQLLFQTKKKKMSFPTELYTWNVQGWIYKDL